MSSKTCQYHLLNKALLDVVDSQTRALILREVAEHYNITEKEACEELTQSDAEHVVDYLGNEALSSAVSFLIKRHGLE